MPDSRAGDGNITSRRSAPAFFYFRIFLISAGLAAAARASAADVPQMPSGFVALADVDASIVQDIRYAGRHNFMGRPVDGYTAPRCILTRSAAENLARVQAGLREHGLSLKVFDCYRPQRAVSDFMRWAADSHATQTKAIYYPHVTKAQLIGEVYIAEKSGHSRGSTVDLTIVPIGSAATAGPTSGDDGCIHKAAVRDGALDMGTGFDCFDPLAHTAALGIAPQQHANRLLLRSLMEQSGFQNYDREWWHYTLRDEPFKDRYFDFVIR